MDEQQARKWVRDGMSWIGQGTTITNTLIDDKIVAMAMSAIDSDLLWPWIWNLIDGLVADPPLTMAADEEFTCAAEKAGIDPMTIIAIISAVVELWRKFRK